MYRITCIICTYQNPEWLRKTIKSLVDQDLPDDKYEIFIIDNNSGDSTQDIIKTFCGAHPNVRSVVEEKIGLSCARNRGIEEARSDIIAFIDDDAKADPGWLQALLDVYDAIPDAWCVGGKTLPLWGSKRPEWLEDNMLLSLSIREWGDVLRPLNWPDRNIGVNISFRKCVFSKVGLFSTSLGRKGQMLLGSEDTEIQQRIHALGKKVYYTPKAVVWHYIPPERVTTKYFFRRRYGNARTMAILKFQQEGRLKLLRELCLNLWRVVWFLYKLPVRCTNTSLRLKHFLAFATLAGWLRQGIPLFFFGYNK